MNLTFYLHTDKARNLQEQSKHVNAAVWNVDIIPEIFIMHPSHRFIMPSFPLPSGPQSPGGDRPLYHLLSHLPGSIPGVWTYMTVHCLLYRQAGSLTSLAEVATPHYTDSNVPLHAGIIMELERLHELPPATLSLCLRTCSCIFLQGCGSSNLLSHSTCRLFPGARLRGCRVTNETNPAISTDLCAHTVRIVYMALTSTGYSYCSTHYNRHLLANTTKISGIP